ncbi:MAG: PIN domain-containing protein [Proteobacteria bacterium]|nr:PIN domain-containing protein [Pseudomonadota bacterium]MBU1738020.1 PIN domain-containing protein [Pseudomonadota bacterium]
MKGVDTNILVRFLVGDDDRQTKKVYTIFKQAESAKNQLFVPLLVVLELLWVLDSVYSIPRNKILDCLSELILMPVLKFESHTTIQEFISTSQKSKHDLADLLIAHSAISQGCERIITFDKKAGRFELFESA